MAKQWKVVGVTPFKGEDYVNLERVDEPTSPFAKKQANISVAQLGAVLSHFGVMDLEAITGVSLK